MTGGRVVVLGRVGRNFAAGMSGGIAYVLDEDGLFESRCNLAMVTLEPVVAEAEQEARLPRELWHQGLADEAILKRLIEHHVHHTGSAEARRILAEWAQYRPRFVKVFPNEYRRALTELAAKNGQIAA
jgi:glutamate synthase domain-containing protein 3